MAVAVGGDIRKVCDRYEVRIALIEAATYRAHKQGD